MGDMLTSLLNESSEEQVCDHKAVREQYDFNRWKLRADTCPVLKIKNMSDIYKTRYCPSADKNCPTEYSELHNCPFWHWMT